MKEREPKTKSIGGIVAGLKTVPPKVFIGIETPHENPDLVNFKSLASTVMRPVPFVEYIRLILKEFFPDAETISIYRTEQDRANETNAISTWMRD